MNNICKGSSVFIHKYLYVVLKRFPSLSIKSVWLIVVFGVKIIIIMSNKLIFIIISFLYIKNMYKFKHIRIVQLNVCRNVILYENYNDKVY